MLWWLYPSRLIWFMLLPVFLACSLMGAESFAIYNHPANYIEGSVFWLGIGGLMSFALAACFAETRPAPQPATPVLPVAVLDKALVLFFALAIGAALLFLAPVLTNPSLVAALASGTSGAQHELRDTLYQLPGVTSFVSMQSLCVVLVMNYARWSGRPLPTLFRWAMAVLVVLCLLRAWLWSERLAFLELVLPAVVCWALFVRGNMRKWLVLAPALGAVGVFALFSIAEYFRTWQEVRNATDMSFLTYVSARFAGYYATALNNGAAIVRFLEPVYTPVNTAQWFYKFPLWPLLNIKLDGSLMMAFDDWFRLMSTRTNVAFTNPSGLYMPFYDFGPAIGSLLWVFLGGISGFLARSMRLGRFTGSVLYPVWFVGVLEILRIFYWGNTRFFPVLVAGGLLAFYLQAQARKAARLAQRNV